MGIKKSNVSDKASEIAKNIWLAGVGAYGKAADQAQGRLEKAGVETPKLFLDLVKAGAALEEGARVSIKSTTRTGKNSVENRINKVRENFNLQRFGRSEELSKLQAKLDLVSKKLDLLTIALTESGAISPAKPVRKPAAKKTPVKKAATRKKVGAAQKPAARKSKI